MAITLLINPGSSSKKFALAKDGKILLVLRFEKNSQGIELCTEQNGEQQKCEGLEVLLYASALDRALEISVEKQLIESVTDISKVGIRVVAPGTSFQAHQIIDDDFIKKLTQKTPSAPLHIPAIIDEINQAQSLLPGVPLLAVSDSAFHADLPKVARNYSLKLTDTKKHDIHRFGYHGISCASVLQKSEKMFGRQRRLIVAHVGSGVSLTAIKDGKSVDTSMGFSPGSGLVMGTRAGDIEPGALLELMRVHSMTVEETYKYLQTESGLKGLADEADFRHLLERKAKGDIETIEALDIFAYRFKKVLGGLVAGLGGLDMLIFTATAVERNPVLRSLLLPADFGLGISLDTNKNEELINHDGVISTEDSQVKIAIIKTEEFVEMEKIAGSFNI